MGSQLFAKKPMDCHHGGSGRCGRAHPSTRTSARINLITLGIGAIIGAGIFVLTRTGCALRGSRA